MDRAVLQSIVDRGLQLIAGRRRGGATELTARCQELLSERGEASGTALALDCAAHYRRLAPDAKSLFSEPSAPRFSTRPENGRVGS